MPRRDATILRERAAQHLEICRAPVQDRRRDLWRPHNSHAANPAPIDVRAFAWHELMHRGHDEAHG